MTAFPSSFTAVDRDAKLLEAVEWVSGSRVLAESFERFRLLCRPLMRPGDPPLPHMGAPWSGRTLVRRWRELRHREWLGEPKAMALPPATDEDKARWLLQDAWNNYRREAPITRRLDDEMLRSLGADVEFVGHFPTDQPWPPEGFTVEHERQHHLIVLRREQQVAEAEFAQMEAARRRLAPSISDNGDDG